MKEAILYKKLPDNQVECFACCHNCIIKKNGFGVCNARKNENGRLYSLVYGKLIVQNIDPIEKKPLALFLPGTRTYSIATAGCNFHCRNCQNYEISQINDINDWLAGVAMRPAEVIKNAISSRCASISYTYTEPTIFVEFALECMKLAHKKELKNVWVSNGFFSEETLQLIVPYLDAINVDLKFFREASYQKICGGTLAPILRNIQSLIRKKIHVEITTLIIPGINDSEKELTEIARFLYNVDREIAWHVSTFFPTYQMLDKNITPIKTLNIAKKIGQKIGLNNIFLGNVY